MGKPADRSTALWVLQRLRQAGHQALFAGGCVRDMLLDRPCVDYDVATDATPDQVSDLFDRVLLIGAQFGVAMVLRKGRTVEVATFRADMSYSDGRRPDGVRFVSAREDALRRDFTINGMFYDPLDEKVIDYVGGRDDLDRGVIRTIGRPEERFAEDYLRMLRTVRFAVRFDFEIDRQTADAIGRNARKISAVSGERICDELTQMLSAPSAGRALRSLGELGLAQVVLGDLFADERLWGRSLRRVEAVADGADLALTLAATLCELGRPAIRKLTRRWGASNHLRDALCFLARGLDLWETAAELPLCEFKRLMANANFARLTALWESQEQIETGAAPLSRRAAERADGIDPQAVAPPPLVTGADLLEMGMHPDAKLGRVLRTLYDAQLNETILTRADALARAGELAGQCDDAPPKTEAGDR